MGFRVPIAEVEWYSQVQAGYRHLVNLKVLNKQLTLLRPNIPKAGIGQHYNTTLAAFSHAHTCMAQVTPIFVGFFL